MTELPEEAHRGGPAAGCDQCCIQAREVHPARAPEHVASVVGAANRSLQSRAVIFAQMVDDPSSRPELFATEAAQYKERQRLFEIIQELVKWENTTNETVLEAARAEIRESWRRTCADHADHPEADGAVRPRQATGVS